MSAPNDIRPSVDSSTGVPFCAYEDCPSYDGKRCRALGFRPQGICEPATRFLVEEHRAHAAGMAVLDGYAEMPRGDSTPFDKALYDECVHRLNVAHALVATVLAQVQK